MNKLIKWVTDLYYSNQRKPDEPEITYQEPIAEPVEEKDPLADYQIRYFDHNIYYRDYILFVTTDYKVFKMDRYKQIKEMNIGIPVISLMKYIDKMFAKMDVTRERVDGIDYYQVGEYRFNVTRNPWSDVGKTINLNIYEDGVLQQCVFWNIQQYQEALNKQNRQAMEDKLQGLLKDLE